MPPEILFQFAWSETYTSIGVYMCVCVYVVFLKNFKTHFKGYLKNNSR